MTPESLGRHPYAVERGPLLGIRGAVATSQALAAQAGMEMLVAGGNAVDAALATAIALTVVEPTSNGIGGDAFALVWDGGRLHGLNGSGRAPAALTVDAVHAGGHTAAMPALGWLPVTVPGAPATWRDLHARFGRLPFTRLFEPAIHYARHGFPVGPAVARQWGAAARSYLPLQGRPEHEGWFATFLPSGRPPRPGDVVRLPDHAATLERLASSSCADFYDGATARAIAGFAASTGGLLTAEDLGAHTSTWVDPISTSYRGVDVWEIPPNGQGITALMALNVLAGFEPARLAADADESWHLQIEATKLAFADAFAHVGDPSRTDVPVTGLLDEAYAARRRALIGPEAGDPPPGDPPRGGTVYLCAADGDGQMVSFIQSNYSGFGSGVVVPGTGVALQNRGANFVLDAGHPNRLEPGKRPYHTIIPGFLTAGGEAIGPFGVMGGFMQPQGHVQVVVHAVDDGMHPQAAIDAPRWRWERGREVAVEPRAPAAVVDALRARGHQVRVDDRIDGFGRGQAIWRLGGALVCATDPRADGAAIVR